MALLCLQAKIHERLLEHVGQWCGEARALRDELKTDTLKKRKYEDLDGEPGARIGPETERGEQSILSFPEPRGLCEGKTMQFLGL